MKKKKTKKGVLRLSLFVAFFFLAGGFFLVKPKSIHPASLTDASATLSNSRLSFYAIINGGASAGATTINIKTSGNYADKDTKHLFPGDTVKIGANTYTVATIVDDDTFVLTSGLSSSVGDGTPVYVIQTGVITVTFTLTSTIPANGYLRILIPDPPSGGNDGLPDTADSTTNGGFDLNQITTANIGVTGGTGCNWGTETLTAGSGNSHKYKVITTSACSGGPITVTLGDNNKALVNPAPIYSGHNRGSADVYTLRIDTFDGDPDSGGNTIDTAYVRVAPIEAVLVSATVEQTLSFTVAASASGSIGCGTTANVTTTSTSIPWGTISQSDTFKDAFQALTVSTNASEGYTLTIEENDQMGKDGNTCPGDAGEANNCIQDTTCGPAACSELAARDWTNATYHGLGFSLMDITGSDTVFDYDGKPSETTCTSGTFCARQLADAENGETSPPSGPPVIMSSSGPANNSRALICYRISISGTQPAGFYYNKVKYTVTATF